MRVLSLLFLSAYCVAGAVGDHAPPIPSTYLTSHPRLGAPDNTYLDAAWTSRTTVKTSGGSKYFFDQANAWTTAAGENYWDCRYLLIAYLSAARHDPSGLGTTYAAKLQAIRKSVFDNGAPGTNASSGSFCIAMVYDWLFNDANFSSSLAGWLLDLQAYSTYWEGGLASIGPSPYNDVEYIDDTLLGLPVAIAQYPDGGAVSRSHMRYAMDYVFNMQVPVWRQLWGPRGTGTTDSSTDGGGCWHETWEYIASVSFGMMHHMGPVLNAWAHATNNYPGLFTTTYPWLRNIGYCTIYAARPDMTLERINGSRDGGWLTPEYTASGGQPAQFGTLELLGDAYNDPTLRGWARLLDWSNITPYGFEPTAFPFAPPDKAVNAANNRSGLAKVRNFPGWGTIFRTGWGENDTFATLRCADHYWSHDIQDIGALTIYSRGPLAIRSGTYIAGSASMHYYLYAKQAISQNVPLVIDGTANSGNDFYSTETVPVSRKDGTVSNLAMPNDGGQRRVGSGWQQLGTTLAQGMQAPSDIAEWKRDREMFRACSNIGFAANPGYSASFIDMTAAYNNTYSHGTRTGTGIYDQPNTSNRTYRVQKAVRGLIWIPRGTAAYAIVYDEITSTNAAMLKKWLLHSIEQPTISGNHFTITRNRSATLTPVNFCSAIYGFGLAYCGTGTYTYAGQLDGWATVTGNAPFAAGNKVCAIGGAGHEFDIGATTDASCNPTYGTNYNECMQGLCDSTQGIGTTPDFIVPDITIASSEPGAWRIEEEVGAAHTQDWYLNVMLARNVSDTNAVSTAPVTTDDGAGNWSTTWKDNGNTCTYTLTLPKNGVGGTVTIQGTGCSTVVN